LVNKKKTKTINKYLKVNDTILEDDVKEKNRLDLNPFLA
jgi:hypothetical protein